MRSKDIRI